VSPTCAGRRTRRTSGRRSTFNGLLDCADRECSGWNISRRNDAQEAAWALEDALLRRFGVLPDQDIGVVLRTDNALVYASELYRKLARSYGLETRPHSSLGYLKPTAWRERQAKQTAQLSRIGGVRSPVRRALPFALVGLVPIDTSEALRYSTATTRNGWRPAGPSRGCIHRRGNATRKGVRNGARWHVVQ
jgi:hypothetical protein